MGLNTNIRRCDTIEELIQLVADNYRMGGAADTAYEIETARDRIIGHGGDKCEDCEEQKEYVCPACTIAEAPNECGQCNSVLECPTCDHEDGWECPECETKFKCPECDGIGDQPPGPPTS